MFGRQKRREQAIEEAGLEAELDVAHLAEFATRQLRDDAPPAFQMFHKSTLDRGDGPYYVAPDSASPLPASLWADLDPAAVEQELQRIRALNDGQGLRIGVVDDGVREFLDGLGPLGRQITRILESGSAESADFFVETGLEGTPSPSEDAPRS